MNIRTIKDLLIDAVKLDREMHGHVGPAPLRAQQIIYEHTFADRAGWGKVLGDRKCQLHAEDADPYGSKGQFARDYIDQFDRDPTPEEISRAQVVHGWVALVDNPEERRALLGWLKSKAGGKAFRRWCKQVEGISQTTGLKRKNRALEKIYLVVARSDRLHDILRLPEGLPFGHDFGDLSATIATGAGETDGIDNWSAPDARSPIEANVPQSAFTWAAKQNARRRQRAAAKRSKTANPQNPVKQNLHDVDRAKPMIRKGFTP